MTSIKFKNYGSIWFQAQLYIPFFLSFSMKQKKIQNLKGGKEK